MPTYSFLPFLQNIPIGTRILTGTLVLFSLLHQVLSQLDANSAALSSAHGGISEIKNSDVYGTATASPYLVLVPGKSFWFPWTFLTAGWVETNIIQVSSASSTLVISAKLSYSFLVCDLRRGSTCRSKVPGTSMGTSRAHKVLYHRHRCIKHHRLRTVLDRVYRDRTSRNIPVSCDFYSSGIICAQVFGT